MESESRITSISYDERGNCLVTILLPQRFREDLKMLKESAINVIIKKFRNKRSKNANAYMWELIGKMTDASGIPSEEIYREAVKCVGVREDMVMTEEAYIGMKRMWSAIGTGWFAEKLDYDEDGNHLLIRRYYGSSVYDTQQMSRLIDYIVMEAKNMGIETATPDELARMKSLWKGAL